MPEFPIDPGPLMDLALLKQARTLLLKTGYLLATDEQLIAEQTRNVLLYGVRQPLLDANEAPVPLPDIKPSDFYPPAPGFTIYARVQDLGYALTDPQADALLPRLIRIVQEHYHNQFDGEPPHYNGCDWYGVEDQRWVDQVIHGYLGQFPRIQRHVHEG